MLPINYALGPHSAVGQLDPNAPWPFVTACPWAIGFYGMVRPVYVGATRQDLGGRLVNNRAEMHKGTPFLKYFRGLNAEGRQPIAKYVPIETKAQAIELFGLDCLLNECAVESGRRSNLVWTPAHVDAVLSDRPIADLVSEFGIGRHHFERLRRRYREVQRPENWFDIEELRWWPIDDVYDLVGKV